MSCILNRHRWMMKLLLLLRYNKVTTVTSMLKSNYYTVDKVNENGHNRNANSCRYCWRDRHKFRLVSVLHRTRDSFSLPGLPPRACRAIEIDLVSGLRLRCKSINVSQSQALVRWRSTIVLASRLATEGIPKSRLGIIDPHFVPPRG